jgi:hypothetical protein
MLTCLSLALLPTVYVVLIVIVAGYAAPTVRCQRNNLGQRSQLNRRGILLDGAGCGSDYKGTAAAHGQDSYCCNARLWVTPVVGL